MDISVYIVVTVHSGDKDNLLYQTRYFFKFYYFIFLVFILMGTYASHRIHLGKLISLTGKLVLR